MRGLIQLSKPTETFAYSATTPGLGAPGLPNELRYHNHPTYGFQVYRLTLCELSGGLAVGVMGALSVSSTINGVCVAADATTTTALFACAGIAQAIVAEDYWYWALVQGIGQGLTNAAVDDGDIAELAADGELDDTSGTGTKVGFFLAAAAGDALCDVYVNVL